MLSPHQSKSVHSYLNECKFRIHKSQHRVLKPDSCQFKATAKGSEKEKQVKGFYGLMTGMGSNGQEKE